MSRASLRLATVVLAVVGVLIVTFSPAAHAAGGSLAAAMLDTGNLPAGFTPDASPTGPVNRQRAQELGLDPSPGESVRTWLAPDGSEVIETAVDAGTRDHARAAAADDVSVLKEQGATRQPVAGLDVYGGYVQAGGIQYFEDVLPLARGPYLFGLHVLVPASSAASAGRLISELGTAQARKVPADTPDTAPASEGLGVAGIVIGVLVGYLLLAGGVAYLRDPLRATPWRVRSRRERPEPGSAADVSAAARRDFRIAVGRLAVQLAGLGLVAYGADVFQVRYWYAYLMAGLAVVWAGGRFIRPAGAGRAIMAGSPRILVTIMRVTASAMILFGLAAIVSYGVYRTQPPGVTAQSLPGLGWPGLGWPGPGWPGPGLLVLGLPGLGLLVLGAIVFLVALRLGSVDARRLMLSDPRPPVLYLRSFGDGSLRLRTATLGRPSLVERFTLRRFGIFEEVLVRYLSRYGPVIAVNPPGTLLASLRAARETVDPPGRPPAVATWMATWMARSELIVFLAPPSQATPGLHWELRTVAEHGQWDKTLVVVPPVPAEQLQARWRGFGAARAGFWPGTVADPHALLLARRHDRWDVTTADRRTQWSYAAALERVLGDPRRPVPAQARGARARARLGPLTLPVMALIVVAAAVMAGAGTWFAMERASAARLPAAARPSAPPSPTPPSPAPPSSALPSWAPPSSALPSSALPSSALAGPSLQDGAASAFRSTPAPPADLALLAPAAARYPGATAIQAVISRYFEAINGRDYAAYLTTQSAGNVLTALQFQTGFESTRDSDVLVTGITTAPDGRPAADVTFTSQQQPQDGPDGESCTHWRVTMFFDRSAGSYTIGTPPTGDHASYQACS